jgi:hypothetical protein
MDKRLQIADATMPLGVVADDQGVESLAGIMGGDASAVTWRRKIFIWKRLFGGPMLFRVGRVR